MIFLAIRYLLERRRQTILTLLGVFFGTMAFVTVSGFFLGFQGFLIDQLVSNTAQIHIQPRQNYLTHHELDSVFFPGVEAPHEKDSKGHISWVTPPSGVEGFFHIQNPQSWYQRLSADPRVEAYSPLLNSAALFTNGNLSSSASLIGCDPVRHSKVINVSEQMTEGKFTDLAAGGNRIIIGEELAKKIGIGLNQTVLVSIGVHPPSPFLVVGKFQTGGRGQDLTAFASLSDVQRVNHTLNHINEIGVKLFDFNLAREMAEDWSLVAPEKTESWDQVAANILAVFKIQNALRFSMIATVLIVAGFGIYNVLNMTVNQKRQDIAILRSMGYDTFDVVMLFFSQGLIVGIIGAFFGIIAGFFLCKFLETIPFGNTPFGSLGHLHISLDIAIYFRAVGLALFASSLASILPARAAGRLTPIEIIRAGG